MLSYVGETYRMTQKEGQYVYIAGGDDIDRCENKQLPCLILNGYRYRAL